MTSSHENGSQLFLAFRKADNLERPREWRKGTALYDLLPEDDHAW